MNRVSGFLSYLFANFGPLIVFYLANHFYGLKAAIALSVLYALAEIAIKRMRKQKLTQFFKVSFAVTLLFGAIDLTLKDSALFRYEASLTNAIFGAYFALTIFRGKPLIQEFHEQKNRAQNNSNPPDDLVRFFRILTGVWALYFFAKAALYTWLANRYTLEDAMLIRGAVGNVSLYLLIFVSTVFGSRLYHLCKSLGLLDPGPAR